ncbi:hypothetical protein SteCoe_25460 [Stentor coeruleus]|uniref:Uncharacterized protein n=1 Tax=Stentor coeruleus TaxID=5963 RepID=A0A1R2BF61_9CILI|nr:hypothetical protein SteCoe_25460 [Stentor coeruleus]
MIEKDKYFVIDLANESEKHQEEDNFLVNLSQKISYSEIVAWNGEAVSLPSSRPLPKNEQGPPSRMLIRRKSNIEISSASPGHKTIKKAFLREKSNVMNKGRKLPNIRPRVLVPKVHFVNAPFHRRPKFNTKLSVLSEGGFLDTVTQFPDSDCMKNSIAISCDLSKKQERLYDYTPIKPVNKTFEISIETIKTNTKPRNFHKTLIGF